MQGDHHPLGGCHENTEVCETDQHQSAILLWKYNTPVLRLACRLPSQGLAKLYPPRERRSMPNIPDLRVRVQHGPHQGGAGAGHAADEDEGHVAVVTVDGPVRPNGVLLPTQYE